MNFIEVKAVFFSEEISMAEEIISALFFSCGIKEVACTIPMAAPDEVMGKVVSTRPDQCCITGYLPLHDSRDDTVDSQIEKIGNRLSRLTEFNITARLETAVVKDTDWENAWKKFFHVTKLNDRIVIRPAWLEYTPAADEIVIDIDPGMAFGTGTHPSTAMCIQLLDTWFEKGFSFLDVGTGSGILMIAAAKLGAKRLHGIDTDKTAIEIAEINLEKNRVARESYRLDCLTTDSLPLHQFDVIAANIIAQVILDILPDICRRLKPKGIAILSGIITRYEDEISKCLESLGLKIIQRRCQDEWLALAVTFRQGS